MICLGAGAAVILALSGPDFTLDWSHSVTRDRWWERWRADAAGLAPVEARIAGPGAGIDLAPDAVLRDGAWHFTPHLPPRPEVTLAASGATGGAWRICARGECHALPEDRGPIRLWQAADCDQG